MGVRRLAFVAAGWLAVMAMPAAANEGNWLDPYGAEANGGAQIAALPSLPIPVARPQRQFDVAALSNAEEFDAATQVIARVDISDQRMYVYVENMLVYTWPVSTGRRGHATPTGRYQPQWLSARHRSRKYDNAPMPWSVFFHDGYAVHGTTDLRRLGRIASHGCVRLHPDNAKTFYRLVENYGKRATLITVVR